jgi:hypothetical protein
MSKLDDLIHSTDHLKDPSIYIDNDDGDEEDMHDRFNEFLKSAIKKDGGSLDDIVGAYYYDEDDESDVPDDEVEENGGETTLDDLVSDCGCGK